MNSKKKGRSKMEIRGGDTVAIKRGKILRSIRNELRWTQIQMALFLCCSPEQIGRMENAKENRKINDYRLDEIIKTLKDSNKRKEKEFNISDELFEKILPLIKELELTNTCVLNNLQFKDINQSGRRAEIEELLNKLSPDSITTRIDITGIGGVGKTTLAIDIAKRCQELQYFDAIILFPTTHKDGTSDSCHKHETTTSNIYDLCDCIRNVIEPNGSPIPSNEIFSIIDDCNKLLSETKTLLIVDRLENIIDDRITSFLKKIPLPSKLLTTGRYHVESPSTFRLSELSTNESIELIKTLCFNTKNSSTNKPLALDRQEQENIAVKTGGLPLAIKWTINQLANNNWDINRLSSHLEYENFIPPILDLFQLSYEQLSPKSIKVISTLALLPVPASGFLLCECNNLSMTDCRLSLIELYNLGLINKDEQLEKTMLDQKYTMPPLTKGFIIHINKKINYQIRKSITSHISHQFFSIAAASAKYKKKLQSFIDDNHDLLSFAMDDIRADKNFVKLGILLAGIKLPKSNLEKILDQYTGKTI